MVFNPAWQRGSRKPGFFLFSNELPFVRQAIVAVKGWHTGVFTPNMLRNSPEIFSFLEQNVLKDAARLFPPDGPPDDAGSSFTKGHLTNSSKSGPGSQYVAWGLNNSSRSAGLIIRIPSSKT